MKKIALSLILAASLSFAIDKSPNINNFDRYTPTNLVSEVKNFDVDNSDLRDLKQLAFDLRTFENRLNDFVSNLQFHNYNETQLDELLSHTDSNDGKAFYLSQKVLEIVSNLDTKMPNILDHFDTQNSDDDYIRTLEDLLATTLRLSDDIGIMADRIGVMADRIVYTEELIGQMADRIVHTEHLIVHDSEVIADSSLHISDLISLKIPNQN